MVAFDYEFGTYVLIDAFSRETAPNCNVYIECVLRILSFCMTHRLAGRLKLQVKSLKERPFKETSADQKTAVSRHPTTL